MPAAQGGDMLYMDWDGVDGIHVGKTTLRSAGGGPPASLVFVDTIAVPEEAATSSAIPDSFRKCVCSPGTITVDPSGGVWLAYSWQHGVAVARSVDGGVTWSTMPIADSGIEGDALSTGSEFQVIKSDSDGNLYVTWARSRSTGATRGGTDIWFSALPHGASTWTHPVQVSTQADAQTCSIPVKGVAVLTIEVNCPGHPRGAHAVWVEPHVAK